MSVGITFGPAVETPGVSVAFPPLVAGYWVEGADAPEPGAGIAELEATYRSIDTEGGYATVESILGGGFQASLVFEGVWDVVLLDSFEEVALLPCQLILEVFEPDEETVAWAVGTSPSHPNPYLCLPDNYGAQEIDIIAGAATIGQVEVTVIDRAQTAGDQDSGWLTERLTSGSLPAIRGRRCRLTRYISPELGYVVIADGPADTPRMDDTYAAYQWVIRDVRDNERKIRAFTRADNWMLPMGTPTGWGSYVDDDGLDQWLVSPREPVVGTYREDVISGSVQLDDYWADAFTPSGFPDTGDVLTRDVEVAEGLLSLMASEVDPVDEGLPHGWERRAYQTWPNIEVLWRPEGSGDPWTVIVPQGMFHLSGAFIPHSLILWAGPNGTGSSNASPTLPDGTSIYAAFRVYIRWPDANSIWTEADGFVGQLQEGNFPTVGQRVEFAVRYVGEPTDAMPLYIEYDDDGETRLTAGRLLQKLYDGEYSDRDPLTGEVASTGIRYNEAALLAMTDPVRLRLTESVDDLRDWAEKKVYAPTGWAPSLDADLSIAPSSQATPSSFDGLPTLTDENVEPVPSWNAGETIINLIQFDYRRWYDPGLGEGNVADSIDHLQARDVAIKYQSLTSITKKEEKAAFEGDAFAALGSLEGESLEEETAAALALARKLYVFDRYNNGAQTVEIPVRRSAVISPIIPGQWVVVGLSWLPDYVTMRRGTLWGGQIVAIHDIDCAWRIFLIEEAVPLVVS